jgi:pimeloyl-ACP methyl ester carboxylesterase
MQRFLLVLAIFALTLTAIAQPIAPPPSVQGDWLGSLTVGNGLSLRILFHIQNTPGGLTGTMDSIDQGARGIPLTAVAVQGADVTINVKAVAGVFIGKFTAAGDSIEGQWTQGAGRLPLTLTRIKNTAAIAAHRPQTPVKPYPYHSEDVTFQNPSAAIQLAGTLTRPEGKGPFTAVVLIAGSGPHNRDEEIMEHKPFLVLSDYLTRHGVEVLRVDKRGIGQSGGKFSDATTADFATDAEAAIAFLKSRPEVSRIGLIGHSEGAEVAPMVAARNKNVAFIVLLAGPGVSGADLLPEQVRQLALARGESEATANRAAEGQREVLAVITGEKDLDTIQRNLTDKLKGTVPDSQMAGVVTTMTSPWYRYFLAYNPATDLAKLHIPVLALSGSLDRQVAPAQNLPSIRQALTDGGNQHFEVVEFPGLNHLFQTAKTGAVSEYASIEETIAPQVLEKIATWINAN